jgi:hypothetical protein
MTGTRCRDLLPASDPLAYAVRCLFLHSLFDLPSEWYLKTRQSVQQFTICQIGESDVHFFVTDHSRSYFTVWVSCR